MKDFNAFPAETNVGNRTKFPADQLVDKAMKTIVSNAVHFRKPPSLQINEEKTAAQEQKRQVLFPCLKKKQMDSFQLQYFNLAPSFVTRKRKPDDQAVPVNSTVNSHNMTSNNVSQGNISSNVCNDTTATYSPSKSDGNTIEKNQQKTKVLSPIPDFMAKNFPLDFPKGLFAGPVSSVIPVLPKTNRIEPCNNRKIENCQQEKNDQHEKDSSNVYDEDLVEEPVKNSMFWMYRNFPHIT